MDEQIEQIARAMALDDWPGNEWNIECFSEREQDEYRKLARGAHSVMAGTIAELDPDIRRRLESVATTLETCGKHGIPIDFAILAHDIRAALAPPRHD